MKSRPMSAIRRNASPRNASPLRTLVRGFWVLLAALFLIEAWLWSHLEPVVERLIALIHWRGLKAALVRRIDSLSPQLTLVVFAIPFFLLMPVKVPRSLADRDAAMDRCRRRAGAGEARRRRPHRLHLRGDAGQAPADCLVSAGLRLLHLGARLGAPEGRSDRAPAAQVAPRAVALPLGPLRGAVSPDPPPRLAAAS
jgi:hypothetical protein